MMQFKRITFAVALAGERRAASSERAGSPWEILGNWGR